MSRPRLVVGWDASAPSRAALGAAARFAGGERIVVVHAREPHHQHTTSRWQELADLEEGERSQALLDEAGRSSLDAELELRSADGPPAEALQRVADEVDADAIVVGSRGLGEAAPLMGSVSAVLLRDAKRPILVIPPGAQ